MKTMATTEVVFSPPEGKGVASTKWRRKTSRAMEKPVAD
jgi:hypothetical protein